MSSNDSNVVDVKNLPILQDEAGLSYVQAGEGFRLEQVVIARDGSPLKGLDYWRPQVESVDKAIEIYGGDTIVALVNAKLAQSTFAAAKNALNKRLNLGDNPTDAEYESAVARLKQTDPCIFDRDSAFGFRPGERELSVQQIGREIAKVMKEATAKLANKDTVGASQLLAKIPILQAQLNKAMEEFTKQLEAV